MRLKDKVAIVTGASSGIGVGIAEVFAEQGAKIVCVAEREQGLQDVVERIEQSGGAAISILCDISREEDVFAMVDKTVATFGRVDVLINNAGINFTKAFDEMTVEEWDRVIAVDLRGTFLCIKACIPHFLKQQVGSVVNIASVHTQAALPGAAPYDAAKCGVVGMTKALAVEYASRRIRFNCLSPGLIDTPIWQDILNTTDDKEACLMHWNSNIPMGRVGKPQEMGKAAAFLASDDASYITGANLMADGGMTSQLISRET